MKGLLMTTSLLTEMLVIGVLYESNTSETDNSAPLASAWYEYGWTDFSYVLAALTVGLGLSSILLTLICSGARNGKGLGSTLVRLGVVIAIGISALTVAGIVYLNYHLCAAAGGLWAISFLPMLLGEVFVCETVLSAGRNLISYLL
jgi:biotin transporter BioY